MSVTDLVRQLPASWYASQPIPPRLLADLQSPTMLWQLALVSRQVGKGLREPLSVVEQAHLTATRRLVRRVSASGVSRLVTERKQTINGSETPPPTRRRA